MQLTEAQMKKTWWAEGDTPVHTDSRVTYTVDGRTAMLLMCRHFITAQRYIYLANWGLTAKMELVRGQDRLPDDATQREALLAELRAEGFQEADIEFWQTHDLSVQNVLGYAVSKGVEVKVSIWKASPVFAVSDAHTSYEELTQVGVDCMLDDSSFGILHHPVESLHQKISVVDGTRAFVGGVDPLIEKGGEFDRWDTHAHPFHTPLRQTSEHTTPHPWHDAHAIIEGPAASDVELNFRQRWNDVIHRHKLEESRLVPEHPTAAGVDTPTILQVARTIPVHTYSFKPLIITGIAQLYKNALHNIEHFVYLENQYFWLHAYTGIELPLISGDSPDMETNLRELANALNNGATMGIILPDRPNVGRALTDEGLTKLREQAPQALHESRLHAFTLAATITDGDTTHYRPIYVHAKVAIIDDLWSTIGSANLNNRGMHDDVEMNVAALDPILAHGMRMMLQGEHLGLASDDDLFVLSRLLGRQHQSVQEQEQAANTLKYLHEQLSDPLVALQKMHDCSWDNLKLYKEKQPLVGHLLPYLTAEEAKQQGLNFREAHGWIEEP